MTSKVAVLLLALMLLCVVADRDAPRKGHKDSSLIAVGEAAEEPIATTGADTVKSALEKSMGALLGEITAATTAAKGAMKLAVTWKQQAAKITSAFHKVNSDTEEQILEKLKAIIPMIGGIEKKSMAALLTGIAADIEKQQTNKDTTDAKKPDDLAQTLTDLETTAGKNLGGQVTPPMSRRASPS